MDAIQLCVAVSALVGRQRVESIGTPKLEVLPAVFLPRLTVSATVEIGYGDLLSFADISYGVDGELIEILIPEVLSIVVACVIDPARFEESASSI